MSFVSLEFLGFVSVCAVVYFCIPKRFRWIVLLAASYTFYALSSQVTFLFILITTLSTFFTAMFLGKVNDAYNMKINSKEIPRDQRKELKAISKKKKRWILMVALIVNLGILAFLKYYNFGLQSIGNLFNTAIERLDLILPLGISFYTFQSVGYVIDVYRGKYKPDRNIAKFALFVSFFPQIVQGPINRYDHIAHQLYKGHSFKWERIKNGTILILWGFFKKLVIADRVAVLVIEISSNYAQYAGSIVFVGALLSTLQVYTDFSGGIDIARGVAQIFGIEMAENFKRPYFAISVSEFWRRWHITLGTWMRDYIFYPLSLSKAATRIGKTFRNVFGNFVGKVLPTSLVSVVVFTIVGIWHGARWGYVAFGLYYGALIGSAALLAPIFLYVFKKAKIRTDCFSWRLFQMLRTILLVGIGRYFVIAPNMRTSLNMLKSTIMDFKIRPLIDGTLNTLGINDYQMGILIFAVIILFIVGFMQELGIGIRDTLSKQNIVFRYIVYLALIFGILLLATPGTSIGVFIYEQF